MTGTSAVVRANPLTKIIVMGLLTVGVVLSIDVLSAGIMTLLILALFPVTGVRPAAAAKRLWFILLAALGAGWGTAILAERSGRVLVDLGAVAITDHSLVLGCAIFLRTIALVLPCVLLAASIDSTELADSLVQLWRLPARFVLAALAAARLLGLFSSELETLRMARRARGVGHRGPFGALAAFFPVSFALLVQAVRRGTRLAMAMEGRAFGAPNRTWSRKVRLRAADYWIMAGAALMSALAITAAVVAGTWNFILT